jgi:hypothetical protein
MQTASNDSWGCIATDSHAMHHLLVRRGQPCLCDSERPDFEPTDFPDIDVTEALSVEPANTD